MKLGEFRNWLKGLGAPPRTKILNTVQNILLSLRHTGMDATEKNFCICLAVGW